MQYEDWKRRVVARFDALVESRAAAFGGKKALRERFDLKESFWSEVRSMRTTRLPLHRMFPIIEFLGEHPIRLLYEAGRDVEDAQLPKIRDDDPKIEDFPEGHIVRRIVALAQGEGQ